MLIKLPKKVSSNKAKTPPEKPSYAPLIDKITITLKVPMADYGAISKAMDKAVESNLLFENTKTSASYEISQLIAIPGATERVHFLFGPKKPYLPDARLNFNLNKLGPEGMSSLHDALTSVFPGGWGYVVEHGRVSMIEIAVDLPGARMHHFHILPNQGLTAAIYKDEGKLKTVYNGKAKGNQLKAYSKSHEIWATINKKKGQKGPPVVRIEQKLTKVGKKIKDLPQLANPLTKFKVVAYPPDPPVDAGKTWKLVWPMFTDSIAVRGLGLALKLLPANQKAIFRKHFAAHAQSWWDPKAIWAEWPKFLKESNLIP